MRTSWARRGAMDGQERSAPIRARQGWRVRFSAQACSAGSQCFPQRRPEFKDANVGNIARRVDTHLPSSGSQHPHAGLRAASGGLRRTLPHLRSRIGLPLRPGTQLYAARRTACAVQGTSGNPGAGTRGAGECQLPRCRQHGDSRCHRPERRALSRRGQRGRFPRRPGAGTASRGRDSRCAVQFRQASGRGPRHDGFSTGS